MFVATKEIYVSALLVALFVRNGQRIKWKFVDGTAMLFLLVYILYLLISPSGIFLRLVSLREGFMIVAFYFIGRLLMFDWDEISWFTKTVVTLSIPIVLFSYMERFFFSEELWIRMGAVDYVKAKYEGAIILNNGMPTQWFTFVDGEVYRRMVGPIGYATGLSRFLAFPVIALFLVGDVIRQNRSKLTYKIYLMLLFGGAMILTLGRGGMLIVLGSLLIWSLTNFKRNIFISALMLALAMIVVTKASIFNPQGAAPTRHMSGFLKGVESLQSSPLGHGLGTSGQMAVTYSDSVDEKVSESYFGSLAYQAGVAGIISYFLFAGTLLINLFGIFKKTRAGNKYLNDLILLGICIFSGIFVTSMLGNAAVSPLSAGLSLIYCGALITAFQKRM